MKLSLIFATLLPSALAANSFAGANVRPAPCVNSHCECSFDNSLPQNYYIYALPTADRIAILNGMQAAGMKVGGRPRIVCSIRLIRPIAIEGPPHLGHGYRRGAEGQQKYCRYVLPDSGCFR
jgi:hypothetical protein